MKKTLITTLFFAFVFVSMVRGNGIKEQMMQVNVQWSKQPESDQILASLDRQGFSNFNEQITLHLQLVERVLRSRDMTHLNAEQKSKRMNLLDQLALYHQQGRYPVNDYLPYKNPVFIDRNNTHCAVGYLMMVSGHDALAQEINAKQKFAYVHEIKVEGVKEWANEFGFTLDELAWIQPTYIVYSNPISLSGGLNGTVYCSVSDTIQQLLFVGGSFSESTLGVMCNNIAQYVNGFSGWGWEALGSGLNGPVKSMILYNNQLYVGGDFTMAGGVNASHVARYDLNSGQWQSIGSLDSTVNCLIFFNNELYAGGNFSGSFAKWNGAQWLDIGNSYLYGQEVRTFEEFNGLLYIGGDFEINLNGGPKKNVLVFNGIQIQASGDGVITPVNDFEVVNNMLYAGCDFYDGVDTCVLARLDSTFWERLATSIMLTSLPQTPYEPSIKKLFNVNNALIGAGNFKVHSFTLFGIGFLKWLTNISPNINFNWDFLPLTMADSTIYTVFPWNSRLGFGGAMERVFDGYQYDTINRIGLLSNALVTNFTDGTNRHFISIYPNPCHDFVNFNIEDKIGLSHVLISDTGGKIILNQSFNEPVSGLNLSELESGFYLLHFYFKEDVFVTKLIKQ